MRWGRRSGFILLEVVLAVALLLIGLTIIGAEVGQSQKSSYESEDLTRVLMLVESKLAELDTGLINLDEEADNEATGDFTLLFPDYGWRMRFDETATEGLRMITLDILYAPRETLEDKFDVEGAEVVYRVHTLRAEPPTVDLQADFGLKDEAIEKLSEDMPLDDFDPAHFNPAIFQHLDFEELVTVLPALMQAFGISLDELTAMVPAELRDLLELPDQQGESSDQQSDSGLEPDLSGRSGLGSGSQLQGSPAGGQRGGRRSVGPGGTRGSTNQENKQ